MEDVDGPMRNCVHGILGCGQGMEVRRQSRKKSQHVDVSEPGRARDSKRDSSRYACSP